MADPAAGPIGSSSRQVAPAGVAQSVVRDPRLDFYRGCAMFIILFAHIPGNWLALWIPARFGFSDATEIFVFCSGMASAIAFGRVFRERGLPMGTARVAHRCWQVYWVHITLFVAVAAAMASLDASGAFERNYVGNLNLTPFFRDPATMLPALLTLSYVPNYFDILPMYLVILAMMPAVVALVRIDGRLAAAAVLILWAATNAGALSLPAEPWSDREWFFNPFGWQLVFFTGFALMAGWLPAPPVDRRLVIVAGAVVLLSVPLAYYRIYLDLPAIRAWRDDWRWAFDKTSFGPLRYLHFVALAYLAWAAAGPHGHRLLPPVGQGTVAMVWRAGLAAVMKVGQQSLAVFAASMFLARLLGVLLDAVGRNHATMAWVNLLGAAIIVGVAYGAGWFKAQPWRRRAGT